MSDHGQMSWTGEFDVEGYALLGCSQCSRCVGLRPGGYKSIVKSSALHTGHITPDVLEAAVALGLWDVEPGVGAEPALSAEVVT